MEHEETTPVVVRGFLALCDEPIESVNVLGAASVS
jgi:hypothetical protein